MDAVEEEKVEAPAEEVEEVVEEVVEATEAIGVITKEA